MMQSFHDVRSLTVANTYLENSNSVTLKLRHGAYVSDPDGDFREVETVTEITLFFQTREAAEALIKAFPREADFCVHTQAAGEAVIP